MSKIMILIIKWVQIKHNHHENIFFNYKYYMLNSTTTEKYLRKREIQILPVKNHSLIGKLFF